MPGQLSHRQTLRWTDSALAPKLAHLEANSARARAVSVFGGLLLSAALLLPTPAHAQQVEGEFSVQRFNPAPGPRNLFTTRTARTDGEMAYSIGLFAHYGFEPFVVRTCSVSMGATDCSNADDLQEVEVVENIVTADLMGSLTIIPRLQLGLRVPVTWANGQPIDADGSATGDKVSGAGLGDPELEVKGRILGEVDSPVVFGAAAFVTAPLGSATQEGLYIGDSSPSVGGRLIVDGLHGPLTWAVNVGGAWREEGVIGPTEIGPELRYGAGLGYAFSPLLRAVVDGFGSSAFSSDRGANGFELDGGVQVTPVDSPFVISAGAGTAVVEAVGVPAVRAFVGFMFVSERRDKDDDTILDDQDQCPTDPEDMDGYQDSDGCPDQDNDLDSILDAQDKCPNSAEDQDGFEDMDGCPELDNDKDGLKDTSDKCPLEPETKNGFEDEDGCPDVPDTDGDGVVDDQDKCVNEAEDTDGFEDTDGCPDPDNDGDGVPDSSDECIDEPETVNEHEDEDGCPDEKPKRRW